jgi:RNA polymerase sigma factor (sigma-70 family)
MITAPLDALRATSRALCASVVGLLGLEPDDLLSAGWLGWQSAAARGLDAAGCRARARGAMLDAIRQWGGLPFDHRTGTVTAAWVDLSAAQSQPVSSVAPRRSRLPARVRRAVSRLPARDRHALTLWTVAGYDHAQIAETLGVTVGTSGRIRSEALAVLRAQLGPAATARARPALTYDGSHPSRSPARTRSPFPTPHEES